MSRSTALGPPMPGEFRCRERLRVRWAEIDAQNIVFNGHYLMYFDTAVAAYWRAMAMPYAATVHPLGGDLYVRKASLEYEGSARYDDLLDIGIRCARIGNSSIVFAGAVFRGEKRLVSGELVYVFADPVSQTARPVPPVLRDAFEAFEAGRPMVELRTGGDEALGAAARKIRRAVFVEEQKVPPEIERDDRDAEAVHVLATNRFGLPLATGRLLQEAPGVARIGRMAVIASLRGSGLGRRVLEALVEAAAARGDRELRLHAQTSAEGFYRRAGFAPIGAEFEEAGIAHREMTRSL